MVSVVVGRAGSSGFITSFTQIFFSAQVFGGRKNLVPADVKLFGVSARRQTLDVLPDVIIVLRVL